MAQDKTKAINRRYSILATIFIVVGVIGLLIGFYYMKILPEYDRPDFHSAAAPIFRRRMIIFYIFGVCAVVFGVIGHINARKITTVSNMITGGVTKIDEIALSSHMSYDRVCKIINKLISKGEYTDVYLDLANREIVHKSASTFSKPINNITCPNCRATTSDKNGVCEFCGASLK